MAQYSRVPAVLERIKALHGHASQITLDLPEKRNALSAAMVSCLQDCLRQLQASTRDLTCRGVLLRSNVEGMQIHPVLMFCPVEGIMQADTPHNGVLVQELIQGPMSVRSCHQGKLYMCVWDSH